MALRAALAQPRGEDQFRRPQPDREDPGGDASVRSVPRSASCRSFVSALEGGSGSRSEAAVVELEAALKQEARPARRTATN